MYKKKHKNKYYNLSRILSKDAQYNVIFGQRSNGKTYSCLEYILNNYVNYNKQGAYLRRWDLDIKKKNMDALFASLVKDGVITRLTDGKYNAVYYYSSRFYLCHVDEDNKQDDVDGRPFMYVFSLVAWQHDKSVSYPDVTTIFFDEFIDKTYYLTDEFVIFANVISTIVRKRTDVKIFMCGNTINKYCPYFKEMGLKHIKNMKQDTIDVYAYGNSGLKVAVEYCEYVTINAESELYFAFDNPKLQMITNGVWEIDVYPHCPCKYRPVDVVFTFFVIFNDEILQCEVIEQPNLIFIFVHQKTTELKNADKDLIYTTDYNPQLNFRRNIFKPMSQLEQKILNLIKTDKVFYQDNDVGDAFKNYIQFCIHNK